MICKNGGWTIKVIPVATIESWMTKFVSYLTLEFRVGLRWRWLRRRSILILWIIRSIILIIVLRFGKKQIVRFIRKANISISWNVKSKVPKVWLTLTVNNLELLYAFFLIEHYILYFFYTVWINIRQDGGN